jgi:hypothetical protein
VILTGDLFHPPEGEENGSAIVIVHGGGWREGDKDSITRLWNISLLERVLFAYVHPTDCLKKSDGLLKYRT